MITKNASHKHPYDAGLFRGFVLGAIVGVYLWEMNKSMGADNNA